MANPNIVSVSSIKGESVGYNLTATTTTTLMTVSSDKLNPTDSPLILVTDTIFGFAIIYSFYPNTIAIAIAFPVEIPLEGVVKLSVPDPSVCNI